METKTDNAIFDKEINALFTNSKTIIKAKDATKLKINGPQVNPVMKCLNKYIKAYELSEPDDHKEYFLNIYKKYRVPILKGYKNDSWLRKNSIIIQFGEGLENVNKEIRIMLSSIYNTACQLRKDAETNLEGLPDEAYENCQELIYPDIFMLHLYRLFRESLPPDNEDRSKLNNLVTEIEGELGIESESQVQTNAPSGFSGMMNLISGLLPKLGIPAPDVSKMPSEQEMSNILNNLLNNPQTQSTISNVFTSLSDCQDLGQLATKLLSGLNDPKLTEVITSTVETTVAGAIQQGPEPANTNPGDENPAEVNIDPSSNDVD